MVLRFLSLLLVASNSLLATELPYLSTGNGEVGSVVATSGRAHNCGLYAVGFDAYLRKENHDLRVDDTVLRERAAAMLKKAVKQGKQPVIDSLYYMVCKYKEEFARPEHSQPFARAIMGDFCKEDFAWACDELWADHYKNKAAVALQYLENVMLKETRGLYRFLHFERDYLGILQDSAVFGELPALAYIMGKNLVGHKIGGTKIQGVPLEGGESIHVFHEGVHFSKIIPVTQDIASQSSSDCPRIETVVLRCEGRSSETVVGLDLSQVGIGERRDFIYQGKVVAQICDTTEVSQVDIYDEEFSFVVQVGDDNKEVVINSKVSCNVTVDGTKFEPRENVDLKIKLSLPCASSVKIFGKYVALAEESFVRTKDLFIEAQEAVI